MIIADLHIHSRYSRATSKQLDPEHLWTAAQHKGLDLLGTGDFTHPAWLDELKQKLTETGDGAYELRPDLARELAPLVPGPCARPVRFLLSGEISCIYKRGGKTRKVHNLVLMPDFAAVERLNARLDRLGNITSDGRPILGLDSRDLLEICLDASPEVIFIPAHIWTPWFSLFGSKSGFDSIEECFGDLTGHIHALETGLSSDPAMNWRLSALDGYTLVSHSDAHSPGKLAREADLLACEPAYPALARALAHPEEGGFAGTLEFFPDEGKYHLDGHRKCGVSLEPERTRELGGRCPECGRPLTVGVLNRVEDLADRPAGARPPGARDFESLIPLDEVLGEVMQRGPNTKGVRLARESLLAKLGPELYILREAPLESLKRAAGAGGPVLAEAIDRMRSGRVQAQAGFDGQFGVVRLFSASEREELKGQRGFWKMTPASRPQKKTRKKAAPPGATPPPVSPAPGEAASDRLNPEQEEAVNYRGGHLIVRAGPGTGKTRLLVHRAASLLAQGLDPEALLLVTFTRKAAAEMAERLALLRPEAARARVRTFHALGADILAQTLGEPPQVLDQDQRDRLLAELTRDLDWKPGAAGLEITRLKQGLDAEPGPEAAPLLAAYEAALARERVCDLDDLVLRAALLLRDDERALSWRGRFQHILVDEYQDVNPAQAAMLKLLTGPETQTAAIGDPDQAVYGFRGADASLFARFEQDFPGARRLGLTRNYRSAGPILSAAQGLMQSSPDQDRPSLTAQAGRGHGPPLAMALADPRAEARWLARTVTELLGGLDSRQAEAAEPGGGGYSAGDIAVLYRLHAQAGPIREALEDAGVPVQTASRVELAETDPLDFKAQRVSLLTMHAAKGLEWPVVFVTGLEQGLLPYLPPGRPPADLSEERRLLFVALTRARERLYLSRALRRTLYGKSTSPGPSPYLDEIPAGLLKKTDPPQGKRRARQMALFRD